MVHLPLIASKVDYVIDTSVFIQHPDSVHSFDNDNLIIPMEVLEELDKLKTNESLGVACRYVNRFLDGLREKGNLLDGITIDNGQTIYISSSSDMSLLPSGMVDSNDNKIISVAFKLKLDGKNPILVSKDIALRIKCDALGIRAIDYTKKNGAGKATGYDGVVTVEVEPDDISNLYANGHLEIPDWYLEEGDPSFFPNEGIVLKSGQSSALAMANSKDEVRKLKYACGKGFAVEGIAPRSKEQVFALELLLDPNIHMVSLTGMAGCGKTLLAIAAAIHHLQHKNYKKIVISRPVQSTSKDIGFLPGTKEEKMAPWLQPIFDNLKVLLSDKGEDHIQRLMDKKIIEVEALTYIRGRTLPNTMFIIDEAQNITHQEAKALLTRMGENSKIVLIGDLYQIDSVKVDETTSGLSSVIELFKSFNRSGHIRLQKGERSELATYASKIM